MIPSTFPALDRFVNRTEDLARLEDWWEGSENNALALYGRRRVGKSWLFRRFAHGKQAVILVADRRTSAPQLQRFARDLAPYAGVTPALSSVADLLGVLYAIGRKDKTLAIIDELPYLLPAGDRERNEVLTSVQRVMEERDDSQLKLILCGSYIGQMEGLMRGPLRGRLTGMLVEPLGLRDARAFMPEGASAESVIERYAVAGGMPPYLTEIAGRDGLRHRVTQRALNPRGPLFSDPREVLEEELRAPGVYYSLLEELSRGPRSLGELAAALSRKTTDLPSYLATLTDMRLVQRIEPVTAREQERSKRYVIADPYLRFWFRFVFPFQEDLRTGLAPTSLYDTEIAPVLAEHVSPVFEDFCREWTRSLGLATSVGSWWGRALDAYRRTGERTTEEVDVVGLQSGVVTVIGECKWTAKRLGLDVLGDLEAFKLPAMRQAKIRFKGDGPRILLFSRSGFSAALRRATEDRDDVDLIDAASMLSPAPPATLP